MVEQIPDMPPGTLVRGQGDDFLNGGPGQDVREVAAEPFPAGRPGRSQS
jgi:hypothetical protein